MKYLYSNIMIRPVHGIVRSRNSERLKKTLQPFFLRYIIDICDPPPPQIQFAVFQFEQNLLLRKVDYFHTFFFLLI